LSSAHRRSVAAPAVPVVCSPSSDKFGLMQTGNPSIVEDSCHMGRRRADLARGVL
jgi:hypothetical protein